MERILKCKVKKIQDVREYSNDFKVQTIIVDAEDSKYENDIPVDFKKDYIDLLTEIKVGDVIEIYYNLQGKLWKDERYFMNLSGWKINILEGVQESSDNGLSDPPSENEDENDILPF